MRTSLLVFTTALVVASVAMLSVAPPPASAAAVGLPTGAILSPTDGAVIPFDTVITFSGDGSDSDGTPLTGGHLFWMSSQNNFLGIGPSFTLNSSTLKAGPHTIWLLLTGNNFLQFSVQVTIWIGPPWTATPTNTPASTNTPTPTSTNTPVPPTATATATPTRSPLPAREPFPTATPWHGRACPDFNGDGRVDWFDVAVIARAMEHHTHDPKFDVNRDGRVGWGDSWETIRQRGRRCGLGAIRAG